MSALRTAEARAWARRAEYRELRLMSRNPFGRHLSSQLMWPVAALSVLVGLAATLTAWGAATAFTHTWLEREARDGVEAIRAGLAHRADLSSKTLAVAARSPGLAAALADGDIALAGSRLSAVADAVQADQVMLVDPDGQAVISYPTTADGQEALTEAIADITDSDAAGMHVVRYSGGYGLISVVSIETTGTAAGWRLCSVAKIDDGLMDSVVAGDDRAGFIVDGEGEVVAQAVSSLAADGTSSPLTEGALAQALQELLADPESAAMVDTAVGQCALVAHRLPLADGSSDIFLVSLAAPGAMGRAVASGTRLVASLSIVAVGLILLLTYHVVRSVVRPLDALTGNTRRLAEGDFSGAVQVTGAQEVRELAENFNRMTESLKEQSDSLMKKVEDMAALYEMSRSLGLTPDPDSLFDSVLDSTLRILEVEIGHIVLVDEKTGALRLRATRGIGLARIGEHVMGDSMSEWVIREGRPLVFNPSSDDGQTSGGPGTLSEVRAALCAPLTSSEGPIGTITVGTRRLGHRFAADDVRLLGTIANHVSIAVGNMSLFSAVQEAYLATVRALAAAVDAKDPYTRGHSDGVAAYALMIGRHLGLSQEQMTALSMAAYLHDIGKIGIGEDILLKPGKLTHAEMCQMRHHPLIGANILEPVAFPWPIAPVVRHHHEHYDGRGYPAGLKGTEIPLLARILAVADAFEAMVTDRPYRRGRSHQEAILELQRCSGTQFDPDVVAAFVEAVESHGAASDGLPAADLHVGAEEMRAVYIAVGESVFANFRRLGGPRLASSLEGRVNERLCEMGIQTIVEEGRFVHEPMLEGDGEDRMHDLEAALGVIMTCVEEASGPRLAERFLCEALQGLPERMRAHAQKLGLSSRI